MKSHEESKVYSLFVYGIILQISIDYYLRRPRVFFNHIDLQSENTMKER